MREAGELGKYMKYREAYRDDGEDYDLWYRLEYREQTRLVDEGSSWKGEAVGVGGIDGLQEPLWGHRLPCTR